MNSSLEQEKIQLLKNGKLINCDILFTFDCCENGKTYVGYTDHLIADNERKNIYISSFNPFDIEMKLEDISDERELRMVHEVLKQLDEEVNG